MSKELLRAITDLREGFQEDDRELIEDAMQRLQELSSGDLRRILNGEVK